jgi:hypothetical protein
MTQRLEANYRYQGMDREYHLYSFIVVYPNTLSF